MEHVPMARRIFEYRCSECNERFESYRDYEDKEIVHECGGMSHRVISAPKLDYLHMGVSLDNPTAADKWAKMHRDAARKANLEKRGY
jgi:DNA-directed RNA polymerase subunit RPC12/RpoP